MTNFTIYSKALFPPWEKLRFLLYFDIYDFEKSLSITKSLRN